MGSVQNNNNMEVKGVCHFVNKRQRKPFLIKVLTANNINGDDLDPHHLKDTDDDTFVDDPDDVSGLDDPNDLGNGSTGSSEKCCHRHTQPRDIILIVTMTIWGALCGVPSMAYVATKFKFERDKDRYPLDPRKNCGLNSWSWCRFHAATYLISLITCLFMWEDVCCCEREPTQGQDGGQLQCCGANCACIEDIDPRTETYEAGSLLAVPMCISIASVMILISSFLMFCYHDRIDWCDETRKTCGRIFDCFEDESSGYVDMSKRNTPKWIMDRSRMTKTSYANLMHQITGDDAQYRKLLGDDSRFNAKKSFKDFRYKLQDTPLFY